MLGLGYDGDLFILAFDHRGSFVKKFFGIEGTPSPEDALRIADAKTRDLRGLPGGARRAGSIASPRASWWTSSSAARSRSARRRST